MTPQEFQTKWLQFSASMHAVDNLTPAVVSSMARNGHQDFCGFMKRNNFHAMASGGDGASYKSDAHES